METAWRFRIIMVMAIIVIIFGDFLGYGNAKIDKGVRRNPTALRENPPHIELDEGTSFSLVDQPSDNEISSKNKLKFTQTKFSESLREACLPKLLCEMAARPAQTLTDRERNLLQLIKSTTLSLAMALAPTRWHFAAHMGQLLRHSGDSLTTAGGCSQLWPQCPYSTQKLMKLSGKVTLK